MAVFVHSPELDRLAYPPASPFKTHRAARTRAIAASMGLLARPNVSEVCPEPAARAEIERFHSPRYIDELVRSAESGAVTPAGIEMGLGTPDCPVFPDMYAYPALAAGATLKAAETVAGGAARYAFNPSGGFHHAAPSRAGGFCYINDIVLACMRLADAGRRVLFLDLDVHHSDGVQNAFYRRSDVMTISLHESGRTLFPGTGFEDEIGEGKGKGFCANFPLPVGTYDEAYLRVLRDGALPLAAAFAPDVIVLEIGMDGLGGVMLETSDWHGGLRDRVLISDGGRREIVDAEIERVLSAVRKTVFPFHGLGNR